MTPEIPWSPRAQDLSQRQRTEDLFQAKLASDAVNKAKLEQLQFLCHEIRNPLNGILGNVSFMLETEIDEEQALLVAGTYDRARQLREVVDDVLDISKVNIGAVQLEQLSFDVVALVSAVAENPTEGDWGEGVLVEAEKGRCEHAKVLGDAFRIQQILKKFVSFCCDEHGAGPFSPGEAAGVVVRVRVDAGEPTHVHGRAECEYTFAVRRAELVVPPEEVYIHTYM